MLLIQRDIHPPFTQIAAVTRVQSFEKPLRAASEAPKTHVEQRVSTGLPRYFRTKAPWRRK